MDTIALSNDEENAIFQDKINGIENGKQRNTLQKALDSKKNIEMICQGAFTNDSLKNEKVKCISSIMSEILKAVITS